MEEKNVFNENLIPIEEAPSGEGADSVNDLSQINSAVQSVSENYTESENNSLQSENDEPIKSDGSDLTAGKERYINTEFGYMTETEYALRLKSVQEERLLIKRRKRRKAVQKPLVLSLFGVFFSIFVGCGLVLSIIGLSMSASRLKKSKCDALIWGRNLGICGIIINVATLALLIFYLCV